MPRNLHELVGYGVGAVALLSLGLTSNRDAAAMPFAARVQAVPAPARTYVIDQRTQGGQALANGELCPTRTRLLVRSEEELPQLRKHYSKQHVHQAPGIGRVSGIVRPASKVESLYPEWERYRKDPTVYVVDFSSPGSASASAGCSL